ncbi:MAG: RecX family transcriptional regulator [Clostridiales bacterium]|jgi:regulatory protein|nr:RecX family transcriptional regulator [Clostridiales bacterium]
MGVITRIEVQKRDKRRANIFVDGSFVCGLSIETVVTMRLKTGGEVDADGLIEAIKEDEKRAAVATLLKMLSAKRVTERQAREALQKREYMDESIECAVDKCRGYGYLDDAAYAADYVAAHKSKLGSLALKYELKQRGVSEDLINYAIEDIDEEEAACGLLKKYMRGGGLSDVKQKNKAVRYLASKGYKYDTVRRAIDCVASETEDEES